MSVTEALEAARVALVKRKERRSLAAAEAELLSKSVTETAAEADMSMSKPVTEKLEAARVALVKRKERGLAAAEAELSKLAGTNKLLAGNLAHEFLTRGTLLGRRRVEMSCAELSCLLMANGGHVAGVVNPAQLLGRSTQVPEVVKTMQPARSTEPHEIGIVNPATQLARSTAEDEAGIVNAKLMANGAHLPGIVNPAQLLGIVNPTQLACSTAKHEIGIVNPSQLLGQPTLQVPGIVDPMQPARSIGHETGIANPTMQFARSTEHETGIVNPTTQLTRSTEHETGVVKPTQPAGSTAEHETNIVNPTQPARSTAKHETGIVNATTQPVRSTTEHETGIVNPTTQPVRSTTEHETDIINPTMQPVRSTTKHETGIVNPTNLARFREDKTGIVKPTKLARSREDETGIAKPTKLARPREDETDILKPMQLGGSTEDDTQIKRARTESSEIRKALFACKMTEGSLVSQHVLRLSGYMQKLETLNCPIPKKLGTRLILDSLPPSYSSFATNYKVSGMDKSMDELFAMLKTSESGIQKDKTTEGEIHKNNTTESGIQKDTNHVVMVNKTTSFKTKAMSNQKGKYNGANGTDKLTNFQIGAHPDAQCFFSKEMGHNDVVMANKTTSFKKKAMSNQKGKYKSASGTDKLMKSQFGAHPDAECFFCKEMGHWKRNCTKYLAEKKKFANSSSVMSAIHVI